MPLQRKTGWAQLKIGLLAMFALGVLAVLIVFMSSEKPLFQKTSPVYAYFDDSFAMTPGATPVRLNGILIGTVGAVELTGSQELNRAVRVTLSIENEALAQIPVDSTANLAQQTVLGARYVNIRRGRSSQPVQPGGEIRTGDTTEIQDLLDEGRTTLSALRSILTRVENIVVEIEDGKGTIGKFIRDETLYNNLVTASNEVNKLVANFNNPNSTLGRLINEDTLYTDLRGTILRVDRLLDGLNAGEGTLGRLLRDEALHDELRATIADVRETFRLINEGDGTVGKLMTTDTLHRRLEDTMSRLDAMLDKINSGQGTIGQLLLNPQLYETMDSTMREVQGFMKDFRANPKKFLTIQLKLF
jgi:phospholipid/cholesterol/gamma-HCH transport system substrate-binding protein